MKVTYLDHMGTDLTVVNAARVSFGKHSHGTGDGRVITKADGCSGWIPIISPADRSLIAFLARGCTSSDWDALGKTLMRGDYPDGEEWEQLYALMNHLRKMPPHWTPFGHCQISLHLKVPFFVANQIKKHQVGFVVNEVSRRYVDTEPEFYEPEAWRKRAKDKKQGSSNEIVVQLKHEEGAEDLWGPFDNQWTPNLHISFNSSQRSLDTYNWLLESGVCPEQARMVLPLSTYTEFWMTGSLFGWANLYNQRTDLHAQRETQEVARQIGGIIEPLFPTSWKELTK